MSKWFTFAKMAYPCVCGGTYIILRFIDYKERAIPAYAEAPASEHGWLTRDQGYPRVCGGTPASPCQAAVWVLLSPRGSADHPTVPADTKSRMDLTVVRALFEAQGLAFGRAPPYAHFLQH